MSQKIETYLTPDGRRAELHVNVLPGNDGEEKVVQEIFEEEQLPKLLKKRIIETKRPVVIEREIETVENNEVVERRRESVHPDVKMELREIVKFKHVEKEDSQSQLTKKDVEEVVKAAVEQANCKEMAPVQKVSPYQALAAETASESNKVSLWNALGILVILAQAAAIGYFLLF